MIDSLSVAIYLEIFSKKVFIFEYLKTVFKFVEIFEIIGLLQDSSD